MKALIIYWSGGGNTKQVAETIDSTLKSGGVISILKSVEDAKEEELLEYDLVFIGAPSYMWQPPTPVQEYIREKMAFYNKRGDIQLRAPKRPGKKGAVFVTFSGPHTGINEAIPAGKCLGQFLEHLGFEPAGEWYVVGKFHGSEENSTKGVMGDIRGRPNQQDLDTVAGNVKELLQA